MNYIKAHVKNDKNKAIRIFIIDEESGAILREKTMNMTPSTENLPKAEAWIKKEYSNYSLTTEGFSANGGSLPPVTSRDGVLVEEGTAVITSDLGRFSSVESSTAETEAKITPQTQASPIPPRPEARGFRHRRRIFRTDVCP